MAECSLADLFSQYLDNDKEQYAVFGRILAIPPDNGPPTELSAGKDTTFLFGEDALSAVRGYVVSDPFTVLMELGLIAEYVRWKLEVMRYKYWLVIFRVEAGSPSPVCAYPATWDGVGEVIAQRFAGAYEDFIRHRDILSTQPCGYFEKESGVKFLKCLELKKESDLTSPYFSYARFLCCPAPRSAWQVRLFLYCELRILEKFTGDGYTLMPNGKKGYKEFIANNFKLSLLPKNQFTIVPLAITSERIEQSLQND